MITFFDLEGITGGKLLQRVSNREITALVMDSRKAVLTDGAVFFAVAGERHDGHLFVSEMYELGIRQFVVEHKIDLHPLPEANVLQVASSVHALQAIVEVHRKQFSLPVIGITGSNGKTIIKEWLYQLLSPDFIIAKNPGSYNSQTGVPLAVWQLQSFHTLAIFEAGISKPGEMARLRSIIQPTIGLFTNIGTAHDEGFTDLDQKIKEKLDLFDSANDIIYCKDHETVDKAVRARCKGRMFTWGKGSNADVRITYDRKQFSIVSKNSTFQIQYGKTDAASVENVSHCIGVMVFLGVNSHVIQERITQLRTIPMRLELKQGNNHCQVIDDTYNNDLAGLQISLDFLNGVQNKKKTIILSDILESGMEEVTLVRQISERLAKVVLLKFIGIGPVLSAHANIIPTSINSQFFRTTEEFLEKTTIADFENEAILVKGARAFQFEKIVQRLQKKIHGTVMEIDLGAMVDNLNFVKSKLKPGVKLMVMVKAFAYGSGSEEVAGLLQYHKVDYLGVAYPDEGVELRRNQIRLPIMVMNPLEGSFATLLEHDLEPEIYTLSMLQSLAKFLEGRACRIHIKLDTGMRRLGFEESDMEELIRILRANSNVKVVSVFSHLAGADDPSHDNFTRDQANRFRAMSDGLNLSLQIQPIRHILNSSGIIRFPELQLDMVRLGIGLYGINPTESVDVPLKPVATLKTVISQIKKIKAGDSIGYGRKGKASRNTTLATIAIGYADGYSRMFSNGTGSVMIHGKLAPVIGNVCMDMTMVDITEIPAREGDEVIIFGNEMPIQEVARKIGTIPYEILTSTSERVKRIFFAESI